MGVKIRVAVTIKTKPACSTFQPAKIFPEVVIGGCTGTMPPRNIAGFRSWAFSLVRPGRCEDGRHCPCTDYLFGCDAADEGGHAFAASDFAALPAAWAPC